MPDKDLSEKRREKWFRRLETSRRGYFFQNWRRARKKGKSFWMEFVKGIYSDMRYLFMWNINLILQLKRYGSAIKYNHGISYIEQWYKMAYLVFVLRASSKRFRTHHLFKPENWKKAREFTYGRHDFIHRALLGYHHENELEILKNKLKFFEFCRAHPFNTPEVLAVFENGEVTYPQAKFTVPTQNLFVKDLEGGQGSGVKKFMYKDGEYYDLQGSSYSKEEIYDLLIEYSENVTGTLVQSTIKNHIEWEKFTNGSVATCRIVTARSPRNDQEIIPMFASFRMPFGQSDADNFSLGGIGSAIDMETGILGDAVSPDPRQAFVTMDFHPDTQARITGEKLYNWEEIIKFAKEIHHHFQTISIGWDIACTDDGLYIIEGNVTWGSNIIEVPSRVPLAHTIYPELFEAWVEKRSYQKDENTE